MGLAFPKACNEYCPKSVMSNNWQITVYSHINQFTSGIFFLLVPRAGLFSVKNQKKFLAINNFFKNETKSGHPNKRLFSLTFREINGYFFYYSRLSSAQLDRWQETKRPIIDQRPVEQTAYRREIKGLVTMDINPFLYNFLAGMSKEPVLDKGIRQKSTKRVNSFIVCSAFCPGPSNRDPRTVTPWTPRNNCMYSRQAEHNGTPRVAC